jgi:hypothetical protein
MKFKKLLFLLLISIMISCDTEDDSGSDEEHHTDPGSKTITISGGYDMNRQYHGNPAIWVDPDNTNKQYIYLTFAMPSPLDPTAPNPGPTNPGVNPPNVGAKDYFTESLSEDPNLVAPLLFTWPEEYGPLVQIQYWDQDKAGDDQWNEWHGNPFRLPETVSAGYRTVEIELTYPDGLDGGMYGYEQRLRLSF